MTPAAQLRNDLADLGVTLAAHGDRLRFQPQDLVTGELLARLRTHKAELLAMLQPHGDTKAYRLIEAAGIPEVSPRGDKIETEKDARKFLDEKKQAERQASEPPTDAHGDAGEADGPQDLAAVRQLQPAAPVTAAGWLERETADAWILERADVAGCEVVDLQPCPTCSGVERWQDLLGGWHCDLCEPRTRATARSRIGRA